MALNPSTLAAFVGRITAADADYPYGSSKNESAPGAGDGTPYLKARADDLFGFQQALLSAATLVPTGNADSVGESQYLQGIIQQVQGRASLYDDTGLADAYILERRADQQVPGGFFVGQRIIFEAGNATTGGAATVDVSDLENEVAGTTVLSLKLPDGTTDPVAGDIAAGQEVELIYRTTYFEIANALISEENAVGVGQTWQDVSGSRSAGVTYTNTTGRPIAVSVGTIEPGSQALSIILSVGGAAIARTTFQSALSNAAACVFGIVPPGETYVAAIGANETIDRWWELRE